MHKPAAGPSTSRNAVEGQKGDAAPLRRDPGLVSLCLTLWNNLGEPSYIALIE